MVIRPTNHFLFKKEVNPPQWLAVLETASLDALNIIFQAIVKILEPMDSTASA